MINSDAIHRSIAEVGDLEKIRDGEISVGDVFRSLARHPAQVISRWNWKSALLGAILRASFYFTVYRASKESLLATLTAALVEFSFRFFTSGISGALVQSFRRASPPWLAMMIVTVSLPIFSHTVEFVTHYAQENLFSSVFAASENKAREKAFQYSVLFSVLSALFNLFVMRKGVMLVGAGSETKSLGQDLKRIPLLIIEFIVILPNAILKSMRTGKILTALGFFSAFGLSVGGIMGIFRGKWSWGWTTALGAWAVLLLFTLLIAVVNLFQKSSTEREL